MVQDDTLRQQQLAAGILHQLLMTLLDAPVGRCVTPWVGLRLRLGFGFGSGVEFTNAMTLNIALDNNPNYSSY